MLKRHLTNAALIAIFIVAYFLLSRWLHPLMGDALYFLALFPVLLAGWSYGALGAMAAGVLCYPLNCAVAAHINDPVFPVSNYSVVGSVSLVFLGGLFGYLSELISQVKQKNLEVSGLAQIVNCSDDAILSKDLDGKVTSWNQGACRVYGYTAPEMVGRPLDCLLPADRKGEVSDILVKVKNGERIENYETTRLTKDGRAIDVSLTVSPITDERGRIVGASTIGRDITQTKQEEERCLRLLEETKRANTELQKMDKIKDEFLSIMTHDLKSPLVAVLGYSDMMLGGLGGQLNEKQRSFLETIKKQGWHLQAMIDGLLDYTRAEFGKLSPKQENFSLNNLVMEEIKAFLPEANQRKIALEYSPPEGQVMVTADEKMIDEVITNLISNALKYSAEGGKVAVALGRSDGSVFFRVSDTGKGLSADNIKHVFDKYFMVDEKGAREKRSLGLGLYIAKKFIEAHRGTISVESPGEGKGTTFSFTLPL